MIIGIERVAPKSCGLIGFIGFSGHMDTNIAIGVVSFAMRRNRHHGDVRPRVRIRGDNGECATYLPLMISIMHLILIIGNYFLSLSIVRATFAFGEQPR